MKIAYLSTDLPRRTGMLKSRWSWPVAARQVEVRWTTWDEFDVEGAVWTVPEAHMKRYRPYRVALSTGALAVLVDLRGLNGGDGIGFRAPRSEKLGPTGVLNALKKANVNATGHGFHSSFKDWTPRTDRRAAARVRAGQRRGVEDGGGVRARRPAEGAASRNGGVVELGLSGGLSACQRLTCCRGGACNESRQSRPAGVPTRAAGGSRVRRTWRANGGLARTAEGARVSVADPGSPVPDGSDARVRRTRSKTPGWQPRFGGVGHVAMLLLAAVYVFAVAAVRADGDHRVFVTVALPEVAGRATWAEERDAFAAHLAQAFRLDPSVAGEFSGWILEASTRQALLPDRLASLIMTESSFRKNVRSAMGAVGPGQIRPDLWGAWCGADLADPEENIACAAGILAHYREVCARSTTDAAACALRSYNLGYRNRDNRYYAAAADRYLAKFERYLADLRSI